MITTQWLTLTLLDRKQKDVNEGNSCCSKTLSHGNPQHHKDKKTGVFSALQPCATVLAFVWTHTLLWMDAFYGARHREIHFYFPWLPLSARQLSCYCRCYIGGTNGSDRSVFSKPHTFEYKAVLYRWLWVACAQFPKFLIKSIVVVMKK